MSNQKFPFPVIMVWPEACVDGAYHQVTNALEIEHVFEGVKAQACGSSQLWVLQVATSEAQIQIFMLVTPHSDVAAEQQAPEPITPPTRPLAQICEFVEQALENLHYLPRLCANPLTEMLDLQKFHRADDNPVVADGLALRRALDQAIEAIAGPHKTAGTGSGTIHLERYLHLRYREQLQHQQVAAQLNCSARHLRRQRKDLVGMVAEFLLAAA